MQTTVYVDVLLALNYIITALLAVCTARLLGIETKRRKIVAAALLGSLGSLTIFLPFMGFFPELIYRLVLSAAIVLTALPAGGVRGFLRGWFVFFASSFFFAGVMLAIWMALAPDGMLYYNGVVYFDVSPITLLATTVCAYALLWLWERISRSGRLRGSLCRATLRLGGRQCTFDALIDSGNGLREPFSGIPVIVCRLDSVRGLFEPDVAAALESGDWAGIEISGGLRFRLVPYSSVGGGGTLPAFLADSLLVKREGGLFRADRAYAAITTGEIGDGSFSAILNPELICVKARPWEEVREWVGLQK